jgi:hypothetical protein
MRAMARFTPRRQTTMRLTSSRGEMSSRNE